MLLAIETCGRYCSVGLFDPRSQKVMCEQNEDLGRGHAERIIPLINELMINSPINLQQLTSIGVTCGPGSFTGLRVGLAAARGLALALNIPAIGVGVLPALAMTIQQNEEDDAIPVTVLQDARRNEVFVQNFDGEGNATDAVSLISIDSIGARLPAKTEILTGTYAQQFYSTLAADARERLTLRGMEAPSIAAISHLAIQSESGLSAHLSPIYVRGADAKRQMSFAVSRTGNH